MRSRFLFERWTEDCVLEFLPHSSQAVRALREMSNHRPRGQVRGAGRSHKEVYKFVNDELISEDVRWSC